MMSKVAGEDIDTLQQQLKEIRREISSLTDKRYEIMHDVEQSKVVLQEKEEAYSTLLVDLEKKKNFEKIKLFQHTKDSRSVGHTFILNSCSNRNNK